MEIDPEELDQLIREIPIAEVATLYGVSKRDIEKRCRAFGISRDVQDYRFKSKSDQRLNPEDPV
ncbi:MAG: RWP-RK domain-containing protein [Chloroflexi bacterium]|nr:RWP-RK domain-containing protein [Chloroflexota bacterium]